MFLELAEWLHNRDHAQETHSWDRAPLDERLLYCEDARAALVFRIRYQLTDAGRSAALEAAAVA